jgi:hypothetical protein
VERETTEALLVIFFDKAARRRDSASSMGKSFPGRAGKEVAPSITRVLGISLRRVVGSPELFGSAAQADGTTDVWGDLLQHGGGDYDGDGRSNADELNAGTDPEVADSEFLLRSFFADEDVVLVTFRTFVGVTYLLERSVDLENWTVESSAVFTDLGDGVGEIEADKNDGTQFMRVTAGGD